MFVRKRDGLLRGVVLLGDIRGAINLGRDPGGGRDDDERTVDGRLGDGVGGGMENLGHAAAKHKSRAANGEGEGNKDYKQAGGRITTRLSLNAHTAAISPHSGQYSGVARRS